MLSTRIDLQLFNHCITQGAFRQHALDSLLECTARKTLLHLDEVGFTDAAWIGRVTEIFFVLRLVSGNDDLGCIDNDDEDESNARDLQNSPKDRAENLMIVDLLRNDISKVCETGSVRADKLFALESFANVHHLVSTVTGKLAGDKTAIDLLRACFPGGSITGAPKLRSMEVIEELEPNRRGLYCGAIGYVGFDGNMDTNIAIRTAVYSHHEIRFYAGGGVVADSELAKEYRETLDKASSMLFLIERFGGDVTLKASKP